MCDLEGRNINIESTKPHKVVVLRHLYICYLFLVC